MVFSVSLIRETKKGNERYKSLYAEADTFAEAENLVLEEIAETEDLDGFVITMISRETERNVLR